MDWVQLSEIINNSNSSILLIIIPIIAALFYYFGRIINIVEVQQQQTVDYYIKGMLFSIIYIAMPVVMTFTLLQSIPLKLVFWQSSVLETVVGLLLYLLHNYLYKHRPLITTNKLIKILQHYPHILFILSTITILSVYAYVTPENIFQSNTIILFIGAFAILTLLASTLGYLITNYPQVKIVLEDKSEINGIILKFGNYVILQHEGSKLLINKDRIISIEYINNKRKDNKPND